MSRYLNQDHKFQPHSGTRGKVRGITKSVGFTQIRTTFCGNSSNTLYISAWMKSGVDRPTSKISLKINVELRQLRAKIAKIAAFRCLVESRKDAIINLQTYSQIALHIKEQSLKHVLLTNPSIQSFSCLYSQGCNF